MSGVRILVGDVFERLAEIPDESAHCVVTSPPYWGLRDYGVAGAIGLEPTLEEHIDMLVRVFREVRRVLRADGTCWLNYGDRYCGSGRGSSRAGSKQRTNKGSLTSKRVDITTGFKLKNLMMMPARLALALQADGWWVRSEIVWSKPSPMPESVTDRPTSAHEKIWLLSKRAHYFYDAEAVRLPRAASSINSHLPSSWCASPNYENQNPRSKKRDKQRGHSRRHAGFNDRWDAMSKAEQQAMGANLRNVWEFPAAHFNDSHFATFPPELPKRCIVAGTSEHGCCAACGAPWRRVARSLARRHETDGFGQRLEANHRTKGWEPGCDCEAGVSPCRVLDPFGGAGTTGLVADRLGRHAILIELNPEYAEMARRRIDKDAPLLTEVELVG